MQTRLQSTFNKSTFNECGMMTRKQKAMFDSLYGKTAREVQERKKKAGYKATQVVSFLKDILRRDWSEWLSPSRFYKYFSDDTFSYVLESPSSSSSSSSSSEKSEKRGERKDSFREKLRREGLEFEEKVFDFYRELFKSGDVVCIGTGRESVRDRKCMNQTKDEIKKGTPLILQGVLWDEGRKCYGMVDMIVRSDVLSELVHHVDDFGLDVKAPNVCKKGENYHYRVIDIKSSTLKINKKGFLSNSGTQKYYKAQVGWYNQMVARIQGYDPLVGYILGKKTLQNKLMSSVFNEALGVIDYSDGEWYGKIDECINWIRTAHQMDYKELFSLTVPLPYAELYPNMRTNVTPEKEKFAEHIKEITTIYYCGTRVRKIAFKNGIKGYDDTSLTPEILGWENPDNVKPKKVEPKDPPYVYKGVKTDIKLIQDKSILIHPTREEGLKTDFFHKNRDYIASVDLEFIKEDFSTLPVVGKKIVVFMIGFSLRILNPHLEQTLGKSELQRVFTAPTLDFNGEREMMRNFLHYLKFVKITNRLNGSLELFHWHNTDSVEWEKMNQRHPDLLLLQAPVGNEPTLFHFTDMLKIFQNEPIMLQGTHGFSLKKVVAKGIEYGILKSHGWLSQCENGADAVVMIKQAEKLAEEKDVPLPTLSLTKQIEEYNQADCDVLLDLFEGIKKYYSS